MGYSGAGGKLTHDKNQKQKISWHCPFKGHIQENLNSFLTLKIYRVHGSLPTLPPPFSFGYNLCTTPAEFMVPLPNGHAKKIADTCCILSGLAEI